MSLTNQEEKELALKYGFKPIPDDRGYKWGYYFEKDTIHVWRGSHICPWIRAERINRVYSNQHVFMCLEDALVNKDGTPFDKWYDER